MGASSSYQFSDLISQNIRRVDIASDWLLLNVGVGKTSSLLTHHATGFLPYL